MKTPLAKTRLRLLPLTIFGAMMLFGVKMAEVWDGARFVIIGGPPPAFAQSAPAPQASPQAPVQQAQPAQPAQPGQQPPAAGAAAPAAPATRAASDTDPRNFTRAEVELLQELSKRRDALDVRSRELDLREQVLGAAEKRIDERIAELKKTDEQTEQNLRSLVKVYENMKPKDAARIFAQLEPDVLLGVVERMKEAKLAPVLAELDPKVAQQITVDLAKRRQINGERRAGVGNG
jgi:flagellar motility protein MotE (MotC chaperone)